MHQFEAWELISMEPSAIDIKTDINWGHEYLNGTLDLVFGLIEVLT